MNNKPKLKIDGGGTKRWLLPNGKLHREDGPAVEYTDGTKCWCRNGKRHREDGPAVEYANGYKEWLYLFIPATQVQANSSFKNLAERFKKL